MKKVTSSDVARRANVSRATVSYVLNNVVGQKISEETVKTVREAISELGYVPNATGRALASRKTRNIGLVCLKSHLSHPFLLQIIDGLTDVVHQHDLRLIIDTIDDTEPGGAILNLTQTKSIDGLVLFEIREKDEDLQIIGQQRFPAVIIGEHPIKELCSVDVESRREARIAVEHLIALGHRGIGCITNASLEYTAGSARLAGYRDALEAAEIEVDESLVRLGAFTPQSGYEAMKELLSTMGASITAVFVASDTVAFGAMRCILEAGLRIPEDIAVMGYDDVPLAAYSYPPLSSMRISGFGLGKEAGNLLLDRIQGNVEAGTKKIFEATLIKRESTMGYQT